MGLGLRLGLGFNVGIRVGMDSTRPSIRVQVGARPYLAHDRHFPIDLVARVNQDHGKRVGLWSGPGLEFVFLDRMRVKVRVRVRDLSVGSRCQRQGRWCGILGWGLGYNTGINIRKRESLPLH